MNRQGVPVIKCFLGELLAILLLVAVSGSTQAAGQPSDFKFVAVYEGMGRYADAVTANPAADRQQLWKSHVVDPYWKLCAEGGEYVDYAPPLAMPFADTASLRTAVAALRAKPIAPVVRAALEKAASMLPGPPATICIIAADSTWTYLRDMHGVGGFTAGAGKIWLTILPVADWSDWLAYVAAHEYHHSVWTARHGQGNPIENMADYLVFEGRADSFAHLAIPGRPAPWTAALTPVQEKKAWETIQRHLTSTSADLLQGLMFGGAEGVPRWAGYTVGFHIVQEFLGRHTDYGVAQWTALEAGELLKQSSYSP